MRKKAPVDKKEGQDMRPYEEGAVRTTSAARDNFADTINRVSYGRERIVIRRRGKEVAAVVPIEDLRLLEELEDRMDLTDAKAALKEAGQKGSIPWARIKKDLGI